MSSSPLASYADKLLLPRGIHQVPRGWGRDPGPGDDHAQGIACRLTASPLANTVETYATGASITNFGSAPTGRPGELLALKV